MLYHVPVIAAFYRKPEEVYYIHPNAKKYMYHSCIEDTFSPFHSASYQYIYTRKKKTPHIKHTLYMGVFHQSLANDLSQFER